MNSIGKYHSQNNEFIHKLEVDYSPKRIEGSKKEEIVKENQELEQQLIEVQKKLVGVLEELEKLKGNGDRLVNELIEARERNQELIGAGDISISSVQEQVQKSEALLQRSENYSFSSPFKGEDSRELSLSSKVGISAIIVSFVLVI